MPIKDTVVDWNKDLKYGWIVNKTINAKTSQANLTSSATDGSAGYCIDLRAHDQGRYYVGHNTCEYTNILIYGDCVVNTDGDLFGIYISHDANNWTLLTAIRPRKPHADFISSGSSPYHFSHSGHIPLRYFAIGNLSNGNMTNFKANYILMKK